jgi:hypothetical protein
MGLVPLRIVVPEVGEAVDWEIVDDPRNPGGKLKQATQTIRTALPPDGYQADGWEEVADDVCDLLKQPTETSIIPGYLDTLKASRIRAIDARTRELLTLGFEYDGHQFSMSDAAQKNWMLLFIGLLAGIVTEGNIPQASTQEEVSYTFENLSSLQAFLSVYASYQTDPGAPLSTGRTLKASISAAETIEEVNLVLDER